jgi:hypothetical protein
MAAIVSAKHEDAELVALHAEFDETERRLALLYDTEEEMAPEQWSLAEKLIGAQLSQLHAQLTALQATTLAGLQARGRSILLQDIEVDDPHSLAAALLRDLLALGVGSAVA